MRRLVDWFVDNRVAANLLMVFVIAGGLITVAVMNQEVFPEISPGLVTVGVAWPGAAPEEVEEGICRKVEEAIDGVEGVRRVTSIAAENGGLVRAELYPDADRSAVLDDVKARVDALTTLPGDAEEPIVTDVSMPKLVMDLMVSGGAGERALKEVTREVRDELAALPELSRVVIAGARKYEISIEVSEDALRRYGLTFDDVANAVRQHSLNLTGGTLRTRGGEIVLRSDTQAYRGDEFRGILLLNAPDGTRLLLGDVARVADGFEDVARWSTLDGKPALTIKVFRTGGQSVPDVARAVYDYVEKKRAELPEGFALTIGTDWAKRLSERLSLLTTNGKWGLLLILVILTLFLRARLAFWVAAGIPTAFLGALWVLPLTGTTINMMSLFGFLVALGIVVDDAIVVGENIHHKNRRGIGGPRAAKEGTREVMMPVVLAALTTIAAFLPMVSLPGTMGQFARDIPVVVTAALTFSLVEALLILPHHLSHGKASRDEGKVRAPRRIAAAAAGLLSRGLEGFVSRAYRPVLGLAVRWRYATLAAGIGAILLTGALLAGRYVRFTFFPPIAGDQVVASLRMPPGTPREETEAAVARIAAGVEAVRAGLRERGWGKVIRHVRVSVGSRPQAAEANWERGEGVPTGSNLGEVFVELEPPGVRGDITAGEVMRRLRETVGGVPGARELSFEVSISGLGPPLEIELRSHRLSDLRAAADRLEAGLGKITGVYDVRDDLEPGKRELLLTTTPEAEALGITQGELARQVRQGFFGEEVQRVQRGPDDVKVMVRYPRGARRSLAALSDMRIRMPGGGEVPFPTVARAREERGPAAIRRADGKRSASVTADVDLAAANTNEITAELRAGLLPRLASEFPGLTWSFQGEQREQADTLGGLVRGSAVALLLIYTLLALAFGSFVQPFLVLLAVPFGMVGAVLGHWWLGWDLTMLSSVGLLAMAGVVVNDSMILVDFVNRARARGMTLHEAVLEAGPRRFRPVLLTSLTTFAGLAPLVFVRSVGAQFLIPMAISLSFGVMFATFVTLLLVPAACLILEDVTGLLGLARRPAARQAPAAGSAEQAERPEDPGSVAERLSTVISPWSGKRVRTAKP